MKRINNLLILAIIFLLLLVHQYPLFHNKLIYGFDSPFYYFVADILSFKNLGTYKLSMPIGFPFLVFLLKEALNISTMLSLKILVLATSILLAMTIFLFSKKAFGKTAAVFSLLLVLATTAYFRLTEDLFNNSISFLFLILSFTYAQNLKSKKNILFSSIFLGLSIWSHSITPIIGFLIYFLYAVLSTKQRKEILLVVALGALLGLPSLIHLLFPAIQVVAVNTTSQVSLKSLPQALTIFSKLSRRWISLSVLTLSLLGFIAMLIEKNKKSAKLIIISSYLVILGLLFIASLGIIDFPERYVLYLIFPAPILASYLVFKLSKRDLLKRFIAYLFVLLLFANHFGKEMHVIMARKPIITQAEYNLFQKVRTIIKEDSLILMSNIKYYWFAAINPQIKISTYGHFYIQKIFKNEKSFGHYPTDSESYKNSLALAKNSPLRPKESFNQLCLLRKKYQAKQLYIFFNINEENLDLSRITAPDKFERIYSEDDYRLFKLTNITCP